MEKLILKSRAKINLSLDVIGKRDDGYHEVDMVMQQVDLYDTLTFEKTDVGKIEIESSNKYIPTDSRNIVYKAILAVNKYLKIENNGIKIIIDKNIPVAAGLGGGSSNAATAIKAYNILYGLNLKKDEMMKIGLKVGADVPFFFEGGCCRANGIGEILTPIKGLNFGWIVICKPNIGVSTKEIYKALNYPMVVMHPDVDGMVEALKNEDRLMISNKLGNVLERITLEKYKVVKNIKDKISNSNAYGSLMSGSGPTVFGLFSNYKSGYKMYKKLGAIYNETYLIRAFNGGKYE
ncbi:MAG: 4-(cytidine 5'-diphospho)-2-C-methyl-D-erythritol kinase [Bacillota bacterium]|nr:4-(cytidine 5'-diphospho)-2-C-methyl-D-erythritol kinase [Bacillota bacterium]